MRRRIVVDTSTIVGATLHPFSTPYLAVMAVLRSDRLCASGDTLEELEKVLAREKFARYISAEARQAFFETVRASAELIEVPTGPPPEPHCRDTKDDKFLALLHASMARLMITSDHDLLTLHPWHGVAIMTPAAFLAQVAVEAQGAPE